MMMSKKSKSVVKETLTAAQRWYWRDPDKARALQRAKYQRYPEKIYAGNRAWQEKNKEHWSMLMKFAYAVRKAKLAGDVEGERLARAAREEYKLSRKNKRRRLVHV